ncbi:unnamed protein product [Agarophyton chilense]
MRALCAGVTDGVAVLLELRGVGYRAEMSADGAHVLLRVGLSHVVQIAAREGDVEVRVLGAQLLQVTGLNRARVHQLAATIRACRPPEPYKGKGIRYRAEHVRRKTATKQ